MPEPQPPDLLDVDLLLMSKAQRREALVLQLIRKATTDNLDTETSTYWQGIVCRHGDLLRQEIAPLVADLDGAMEAAGEHRGIPFTEDEALQIVATVVMTRWLDAEISVIKREQVRP